MSERPLNGHGTVTRRGVVPGQKGPRVLQATVEVSGYVVDGKRAETAEPEGEGAGGSADGAHTERVPPEAS